MRNEKLRVEHVIEIERKNCLEEVEMGKGLNRIGSLKRAWDIRWSLHLNSISSLIKMFDATCIVDDNISNGDTAYTQHGDIESTHEILTSSEFVVILSLMKKIIKIIYPLCQALKCKTWDILNVCNSLKEANL